MTVHEATKQLIDSLTDIYDDSEAANITELIVEHITRWSRIERTTNKDVPLSYAQKELLEQSVKRLQQHEPVQYIINEAWFAGMRFYVDKNVLIPRPETEELVEWVVKEFKTKNPDPITAGNKILDVGTGSGCIAIALKKNLPDAEIWACDISDEVLNIARMNADALGATIDFTPLNFLEADQRNQLPHVDIIVSNPPYVPQQDRAEMRKNVVDHEPSIALFVPDNDPLVFYKAIADFAKEKLNEGGSIYLEIHEGLAEKIDHLFRTKDYSSVEIKKDLQGKDRMVRVKLCVESSESGIITID